MPEQPAAGGEPQHGGPPAKSALVFMLLALVLPGAHDLYLGGNRRRLGAYRLISLVLCLPLVAAFGLGLFLFVFIWLTTQLEVVATLLRARKQPSPFRR